MRLIILAFIVSFLLACPRYNQPSRCLGDLPVEDGETMSFRIYQSNEFDHSTAITCEIVNNQDQVIFREKFITGTMDYNTDLSNFYSGVHDSIAYLCYNNQYKVFAVFDSKRNIGYPFNDLEYDRSYILADTLFKRIHEYEPKLKAKWRE